LRNNPGGFLSSAQDVLGRFYSGVALYEQDGSGQMKQLNTVAGQADTHVGAITLVVLVNHSSASASEIVAGALRSERPDTILIGEQTFGKGSVQNIHPLSDGGSTRITFAHWLTPDKHAIHKVGIVPQYIVPDAAQADQLAPCVGDRQPPAGASLCGDSQLYAAIQFLTTGEVPAASAASN
jgi:carboxyl-terminal processing protease